MTQELGWSPHHPSWRLGFPMTYSAIAVADGQASSRGSGASRPRSYGVAVAGSVPAEGHNSAEGADDDGVVV
jgi:hypothetical protein